MVDYTRLEKEVMDFIRDSKLESFDAEELAEELSGEKASKEDRETVPERDRIDAERADAMNRRFEDVVLNERAEEKFL